MRKFSLHNLFKQSPSVIARKIENRVVLLNTITGKIYSLNDTASFLWNHLKKKATLEELIKILCGIYDVLREEAYQDIKEFLRRYLKYKLIVRE